VTLPNSLRALALTGAALVVALVGYLKVYAWPRDAVLADIERQRSANAGTGSTQSPAQPASARHEVLL